MFGEDGGERADLTGADLTGARLNGARNADKIMWNIYTTFYPLQCPETGAYVGYKKARGLIVELEITSDYDKNFVYIVGETVEVPNFDVNRWNECAPGIHHFITREEAVKYS